MYYVEKLTAYSWLFYVLPHILKRRRNVNQDLLVNYLDVSWPGLIVAQLTSIGRKIKFERLNFNIFDIRDENDESIWWKVVFEDLVAIREHFKEHPEFQKIIQKHQKENHLLRFFMGRLFVFNDNPFIIIKMLFLFRVARWKCGNDNQKLINIFLTSSQSPWLSEVRCWAEKQNINVVLVGRAVNFDSQKFILQLKKVKHLIKEALYFWMVFKYKISHKSSSPEKIKTYDAMRRKNLGPKLAVEYYGHLNLASADLHSDLFFWQQSRILNEDILIYFQHSKYPLTDQILNEINQNSMSALVINSRATTTPHVPIFKYVAQKSNAHYSEARLSNQSNHLIRGDLHQQMADYEQQLDYWIHLIDRNDIKIHVSWYKHEAKCFPMNDALKKTGRVGVMYQRSYEHMFTPLAFVSTDVFFGFSRQSSHIESDFDSCIPYFVTTGYLGDHRFALLKEEARMIRNNLKKNGAEKILSFTDESSVDDSRWCLGHEATRENYTYLLNQVLKDSKFGLILKPKIPGTLRSRLADVRSLLSDAQKTGRCFVFDEGEFFGSHSPAAATLVADIAVHGHLFGATAGVEAALTGTPTLMLDREGCTQSPLYRLGEGRVIFRSWDQLWQACQDHWNAPGGVSGFGDWSSVINDIDPFRDGRAAERMGTYLEWLMEGLKNKLPRETVLADAAERYCKIWGKDKVFSVNCHLREHAPAS